MPRFEPHPQRRTAVIAGASSGIGAATAIALATGGQPVALGARRAAQCEELAATIRAGGGEAIALPLDVADDDSVKSFAAAVTGELGPPEILVSCAGDAEPRRLHELETTEFVRQVEVNLTGAHRLVAAIVPGMVARRRGDVVFVTSDVVLTPRPHMGAYVAAKHGLEGMAQTMQMELEGTGVRVSVVRPGPTASGMGLAWDIGPVEAMLADWAKWGLARHSYFLRPSDVAAAVTAVVSTPRGSHLTLVEIQLEAPLAAGRTQASTQPATAPAPARTQTPTPTPTPTPEDAP
jgi:NAD(P)-dependent dehydrogenase (short-subunit alcohol dehydrogenase family)